MKKKHIISLLVLSLLIGIAIFSYQFKVKKEASKSKKLFSFTEESARKWEVSYNGFSMTAVASNDGAFYIVSPVQMVIPEQEFIANIKNFNSCEYFNIVSDTTNNEKEFGIDRGNYYRVYIGTREGKDITHTVYKGFATKAPTGFYLVYSGSDKVYSVEDWVILALEKSLEDVMDKDFLHIEPEEITYIKKKNIEIKKEGHFWTLNGLPKEKLNIQNVDEFAQSLGYLKADRVLRLEEQKKVSFGSALSVSVGYVKKNEKYKTKNFLFTAVESKYYIKLLKGERVYEVADYLYRPLTNDLKYYLKTSSNLQQ